MAIDVALQLEVEDLFSRYGALLDDGPLREWPDLFAEQCLYLLIPRDNYDCGLPLAIIRCESRGMLTDRIRAAQETIMHEPRYLRHQITNVRVTNVTGARIDVTAHFSVMEVLPDELPRILAVGRYIDVIQRRSDGALEFSEKRCVYDSVLVPNTIVYPL
jgi:3-phenylpropionate/cinnamic acid dioxygenase small subunit